MFSLVLVILGKNNRKSSKLIIFICLFWGTVHSCTSNSSKVKAEKVGFLNLMFLQLCKGNFVTVSKVHVKMAKYFLIWKIVGSISPQLDFQAQLCWSSQEQLESGLFTFEKMKKKMKKSQNWFKNYCRDRKIIIWNWKYMFHSKFHWFALVCAGLRCLVYLS